MSGPQRRRYRVFVYGTFLEGEADHALLGPDAQFLGPAKSKPIYKLVEIGAAAGVIEGGDTAVHGELYELDVQTLAACDIKREHPVLYERRPIELDDDSQAQAYFLRAEQARGFRRVPDGDWRRRFTSRRHGEVEPGPFVRWARSRYSRR